MHLSKELSNIGGLKALVLFLFVIIFSPSRAQTDSIPLLSYSEPKTYVLGDISVSGTQFLDPTAMISVTGLKPGDKITVPGEQISTAIKKLWKQGILGNVEVTISKIEGNKIYLNFHLEERRRLSKFVFTGTRKSETEDLREKIRLIKGKVVTDALIKNSRQTILKHFREKGFLNTTVKVTREVDTTVANSVILTFDVKKGKKVKIEQLRIEDNVAFTDARLRRKMKKTKQRTPGKIWSSSKFITKEFKADKEKIIDFYNTKGYRDMEIVGDTVYPYYQKTVNGKKISRHAVFYTQSQADSTNREVLASAEELKLLKSRLDSLKSQEKQAKHLLPRKIIRDTLSGDTTVAHYNKIRDRVKVAKADVEYTKAKIKNIKQTKYLVLQESDVVDSLPITDRVTVKVFVDEGRRYYFRNIFWRGNTLYEDKYLQDILAIKPGDIYDKELLERRLNYNPNGADISSLYLDDGYLFFSVEPIEVRVEGDSIDIEMRIYEGPQATINNVIVEGNTKTNDHVIYRELRTLPGDKFNRSLLIRSQRELSVLQYFDPEKIGINPIPDAARGTVDIKYSVTEKPSDQIQLSGGYAAYLGFVGTLGLQFNNFSLRNVANFREYKPLPAGDGQRLALSMQANGRQYQNYSLSFTEPWLGGKRPNSLTVGVSRSVSRTLVNQFTRRANSFAALGRSEDGRLVITMASVTLGRRLRWPDDFFTLSHTLSFQNLDLFELTAFEVEKGKLIDKGSFNNFALTNTIARNSIDNPTYPRSGSSLSLAISTSPPYSLFESKEKIEKKSLEEKYKWVEYHKWMFDGSFFTRIVGNLVLNTRMHYGFLGSYNPMVGLSPFERFRLGGSGLTGFNFFLGYDLIGLRGYEDAQVKNDPNQNAGVVYNKHVLELRYPITLNPAASIFVLTFAEAGNNWQDYTRFNPFTQYRSVGVGARIFMPAFGLLGLDYGYGLDEVPGIPTASRNRFTFTIGQQIR